MCRLIRQRMCLLHLAAIWVMMSAGQSMYAGAAEPATVRLAKAETDISTPDARGGILIRELARQALLVTARDEMGLFTRDASLGETFPTADAEHPTLEIETSAGKESLQINLQQLAGDITKRLGELKVPLGKDPLDYRALTTALEVWSHGPAIEMLRKGGYDGQPLRAADTGELSPEVVDQLEQMNFFSQFDCARSLHRAERDLGQSPQTLAALVRAYAHLNLLTQGHWSSVHKAFMARSLVYASRLVRVSDASPWSLYHRAYAEALAGRHAEALEDLAAAKKKQAAAAEPAGAVAPEAPAWVPLIEAFCKYDLPKLRKPVSGSYEPLRNLLSFVAVEQTDAQYLVLSSAWKAWQESKECLRILDGTSRYVGVIMSHRITVNGPMNFARSMDRRLQAMAGLPAAIAPILKTPAPELQEEKQYTAEDISIADFPRQTGIVQALDAAAESEPVEPSWQVLARLIDEAAFVQTVMRVDFMRRALGIRVDEYTAAALPRFESHAYRSLLEGYGLDFTRELLKVWEMFRNTPTVDAGYYLAPLLVWARSFPIPDKNFLPSRWELINRHADDLGRDLESAAYFSTNKAYAHQLLQVSPHSPQAIGLLIQLDQAYSRPRLKTWEQQHGGDAPVMRSLLQHYQATNQVKDVERCARKYVNISADAWAFEALALNYWNSGRPEKWVSTMQELLEHDDLTLAHARVQGTLARYMMRSEDWEKAFPYAQAAAQTGSYDGMKTLATCLEGMERWDEAESMIQAIATRYDNQGILWYVWCERTNHGNREAALALANGYIDQVKARARPDDLEWIYIVYTLDHKTDEARAAIQKSFARSNNPFAGVHLALACDAAGMVAERDAALKQIVERGAKYRSPEGSLTSTIELARWMQAYFSGTQYQAPSTDSASTETEAGSNSPSLAAGAAAEAGTLKSDAPDAVPAGEGAPRPLDLDSVERILSSATLSQRTNLEYFMARFCQLHGDPINVRDFAQRCSDSTETYKFNHVLARQLLRTLPATDEPVDEKPAEDVPAADKPAGG